MKKTYRCTGLPGKDCKNLTSVLHEPCASGRIKKVCVKFLIKVPKCSECHYTRHYDPSVTKHERKKMDMYDCEKLELDYYKTIRAISNKRNRGYLEKGIEKRKKIIESWEE